MFDLFDKIDEPGVYDLTNEVYHSDCCVGPSVSSTGLKTIAKDGAAIYWATSPYNPEAAERRRTKALDFGTASHIAILEPAEFDRRLVVSPYEEFRSNEAKAWRSAQRVAGKTIVKTADVAEIKAMTAALDAHPRARGMLEAGRIEQSFVWRDGSGVWLKARPDFVPLQSGRWIVDYKTTSDLDRFWNQALLDERFDLQAALYHRALKEIAGIDALGLLFIAQEKKPPYRIGLFPLKADGFVTWRRAQNGLARSIAAFAHGIETGAWPTGYENPVEPPEWLALKFEKEEQAHG